MNIMMKKLSWLAVGFIYTSLGLVPAYADDTEIYFGGSSISTGVETRPNVLFVLDTSGSMGWSLSGSRDGSNERLDALKQAMTSLLSSVSNVNIGIMRFTNPGGPVLHEVAYIDEISGGSTVTVTSQVNDSQSDAEESVVGGAVRLSDDTLEFVETYVSSGTVEWPVYNTLADISEESRNNSGGTSVGQIIKLSGTSPASIDIELMTDSGGNFNQFVGLRFRPSGAVVPLGSTVLTSNFEFKIRQYASQNSNDDLTIEVKGEKVDSGEFTTDAFDVSSRYFNATANHVDWEIDNSPAAGEALISGDISSVLQEMMDARTLTSDAFTFLLREAATSSGGRRELHKENGGDKPTLHFTYSSGSSSEQAAGVRFSDVAIPSKARITNAYIEFSAASSNADVATYTVSAENTGNASEFTTAANNIRGRTKTTNQINWSNVEAWTEGEAYNSPDLTTIVQELVDHADWCGGNAMAFILEGSATGRRVARAYDGAPGSAPRLVVEYDSLTVPDAGGCINAERSYQVSSESDDSEQSNLNGGSNVGGNTLNLRSDRRLVGVRFNGLSIPQGSTVTSAYLKFKSEDDDSGSSTISIAAEDVDDASTFNGGNNDLVSRTKTTASVTWNPEDWEEREFYYSADISSLVNEVVGRAGWDVGNSMAFILQHLAGSGRDIVSYNDQAGNAPRLIINYTTSDFSSSLVTVREELQSIVDNEIIAAGSTPIVETYHEAALYMRGDNVLYGKDRSTDSGHDTITRVSTPKSYSGGTLVRQSGCSDANLNSDECRTEYISGTPTYISPMEYSCQENHIVFLTDGEPTGGNDSLDEIEALIGKNCADYSDNNYECGEELAEFLANADQDDGNGSLSGDQLVTTHTIALIDGASTWLSNIAAQGGGDYYPISGSSVPEVVGNLTEAFDTILGGVLDVDSSHSSPSVSISLLNRLTHRNEIYYAVFKPLESPNWPGNVKKFGLSGANVDIVDTNGNLAVLAGTDNFKDSSQSIWSPSVDGNNVELGGAAANIPPPSIRKVYVHHDTSSSSNLTASDNLMVTSNAEITKEMLGISGATDTERENLINWTRGYDIQDDDDDGSTTDARNAMSDPLHSSPVVVTYDADPNGDGDGADAKYYLFFGTNGGMLHAIDGRTGVEKFAILPSDLLPNLNTYYQNGDGVTKPYGLDGRATVWVEDVDGDGKIESSDGDHVYLYIGMRRGGRNYYAYDVTNLNAPKLLWEVKGGEGDFSELGQSWSKPLLTKVKYKSGGTAVTKQVLIFGGGYDENQDDVAERTVDSMGRAIYMVDAETGAKLWSAGKDFTGNAEDVDDMLYSIPTRLSGADINGDKTIDVLFFGDVGGQVFRIDFDSSGTKTLSQLSRTQRIADISEDNDETNTRRFYHGADIALTRSGGDKYLTILIGSGYKAHPLDTRSNDRLYAFKQLIDGGATYTDLVESDLYDATENLLQDGSTSERAAAESELRNSKGWYIRMENLGEKVFFRPVVVDGKVVFTTYEPRVVVTTCQPEVGLTREYIINVLDGTAVIDRDDISGLSKGDRSREVALTGIVDDLVVVVTEEGSAAYLGPIKSDLDLGSDRAIRTFWHQE